MPLTLSLYELGTWLGDAYAVYAWLLAFGCLGPHYFMLLFYWLAARDDLWPRARLAFEIGYGLINPVVYFLVLQPGLFRSVSSTWLTITSVTALTGYWAFRLFGDAEPFSRPIARHVLPRLLSLCLALVLIFAVRDLVDYFRNGDAFGHLLGALFVAPLYLFPLAIGFQQLARIRSSSMWHHMIILRGGLAWFGVLVVAVFSSAAVWASGSNSNVDDVRARLLSHRETILAEAQQRGLDPRIVPALVLVTHDQHLSSFKLGAEEMAAAAWSTDDSSYLALHDAVDPSIGISQIKPSTFIRARWSWREARELYVEPGRCVRAKGSGPPLRSDHNDRSCGHNRVDGDEYERLLYPGNGLRPAPPSGESDSKRETVRLLSSDAQNLRAAAFLLDMYATQWEAANPAWSIRSRADILATLFQIGTKRSIPKPDPKANDFGRRVAEEMDSKWVTENF